MVFGREKAIYHGCFDVERQKSSLNLCIEIFSAGPKAQVTTAFCGEKFFVGEKTTMDTSMMSSTT
jgi:hypothetical protein